MTKKNQPNNFELKAESKETAHYKDHDFVLSVFLYMTDNDQLWTIWNVQDNLTILFFFFAQNAREILREHSP